MLLIYNMINIFIRLIGIDGLNCNFISILLFYLNIQYIYWFELPSHYKIVNQSKTKISAFYNLTMYFSDTFFKMLFSFIVLVNKFEH